MDFRRLLLPLLALAASLGSAQLRVEGAGKTSAQISSAMDVQARQFAKVAAHLTASARKARMQGQRHRAQFPFALPMRLEVLHPAAQVKPATTKTLTLAFDTTGSRIFPAAYQSLLQTVYTTALPTINAVFGPPSAGGTVYVRNYDADIGDRDAVAGGYYTPNNGSGQAEIRFPVYNANEAVAVNFIHTILLAYQGSKPYTYDAFNEGLVRAAVMKICRTPGSLPATLDTSVVASVLENSYDVGDSYDWDNQRALGGPVFIAANLRATALPDGGSIGGLYLLRYIMAGSAWSKVLTEYPGFIASFNQAYYTQTGLSANPAGLVALGQTVLNSLTGAGATVEGRTFADWFQHQFILETTQSYGTKILCQPIPITSNLAGSDFGVFVIQANYFSTGLDGTENLLSGTCYPVFWDNNFNRVTPSVQDQLISIAGAYGSVAPNFPDFYSGNPYRVTVELPVLDQLARVTVPAGAIATATNTTGNTLYGTVEGAPPISGSTYSVVVSYPGGTPLSTPVINGAFGANITDPTFANPAKVTFKVVQTTGTTNKVLLTRVVDKSVGTLGVDLVVNGEGTISQPLSGGLSLIGFPLDPFASSAPAELGISPATLQMARYNPSTAAYDMYPYLEPPVSGHGYYFRLPAAQPKFTIAGRGNINFPYSVALRPGWNVITCPTNQAVPFGNVQIVHALDNPTSYQSSVGVTIGTDAFALTPGAVDTASGLVETGSLNAVANFQPGQGYLVRVLAPEGVVMTFFPASPPIGPFVQPATHGWGVRLEITDGVRTIPLHLGAVKEAKTDVDWRFCGQLGPSAGGLQPVANRGMRFFRDVRKDTGALQTFQVRLEGLIPGKSYTVRFPVEKGMIRLMQLIDNGAVRTVGPSTLWTFKAASTYKDVQLKISGVAL